MGGKTITLLFTKDRSTEPAAILQDHTCGEYHDYYNDWRWAVHFMIYYGINKRKMEMNSIYKSWRCKYINEEEEFSGDLNEFADQEWFVSTTVGDFENDPKNPIDVEKLSAWGDNTVITLESSRKEAFPEAEKMIFHMKMNHEDGISSELMDFSLEYIEEKIEELKMKTRGISYNDDKSISIELSNKSEACNIYCYNVKKQVFDPLIDKFKLEIFYEAEEEEE